MKVKAGGEKEVVLAHNKNKEVYEESLNKNSTRHDGFVKKFSLALLILIGKAGYELLERNFKDALPAYSTLQRMMSLKD